MKNDFPESKKTLTPEMEFSEKLTFRDYLIATEQKANKPLPIWRLIAPLFVQVGLILGVPSQAMYTDMTGKTVILQPVPINPNDVVRGTSLNLDYNISRPETLRRLPGWNEWLRRNSRRGRQISQGSILYLILQERQSFNRNQERESFDRNQERESFDRNQERTSFDRNQERTSFDRNQERTSFDRNELQSWKPIRVSSNRPVSLSNNQVALKGNYQDGLVNYGLENYFIPDEQRRQINEDIAQVRENRNGRQQPIFVRVKVDPQGNAVPLGLSIKDASGERRDRNYRFQ
ncbi:MAG: GDYXXLXY domain-containing protein [Dolichospermum sp. DET50]|nr:GDYXXLXY domain-containing protein [Dolichospermum sp. DET66]MBS3033350.1 GDYXXLXY domain-containing protein [Dolichospermum sp. DET67]MBS3038554.1 GDYXXLXY domain-containing protein [Dolichospermum sp. DET50]QSX70430.1 MAG: GDYXXLXY domain-containing protein [Dolichospermum sp. DET69]